jgi:uncharacterized protein YecT (DUF1311 family)
MVQCTDKAYAAWDKELNKNYGELMRTLKPAQKETLRVAQLEWIKYRFGIQVYRLDLRYPSGDDVHSDAD